MRNRIIKQFLLNLVILSFPTFILASEITGFLGQGQQGLQAQVAQLSAEVGELPRGGGGGYIPPTPPATSITGDINGDGKVDKYDFSLMMADWGKTGTNLRSDFNHDGKVDKYDFAILMAKWSFT
jgi:hypothetical protein